MHCSKCGSELREGAKFCNKCGSPVESVTAPVESITTSVENNSVPETQGTGKKNGTSRKAITIISLSIVGVLLLIALCFTIFILPKSTDEAVITSTETEDDEENDIDKEKEAIVDEAATVTGSKKKNEEAEQVASEEEADSVEEEVYAEESASGADAVAVNSSFYGIWCYGVLKEDDAEAYADTMKDAGIDAKVFLSSEWSNLNQKPYYVVTAGTYDTEELAKENLDMVKSLGYADAYVKYSGDYIGD